MNFNCILCKYNKYNKKGDECWNHMEKDEYGYPIGECNSLSNIYYGRLIKHFPFNIINKIVNEIQWRQANKYYEDFSKDGTENSEMSHIWGIKSSCDLSPAPCGLLTMNDFDITYLKKENKYILGVETMLGFKSSEECIEYMNWILDKFTEWMKENNYNTDIVLDMYQVFTQGININTEFNDIETAYATFKLLVKGFEGNGLPMEDNNGK